MAKLRLVHRCADCGASFPKWSGQGSACGAWNTLVEDVEGPDPVLTDPRVHGAPAVAQPYADVPSSAGRPAPTGMAELDRVLGDGIVPGSVTLLGGEPGIGKSTLLLQAAAAFARDTGPVLYASGEESEHQVKMRGERLGVGAVSYTHLRAPETVLDLVCRLLLDKNKHYLTLRPAHSYRR